MDKRTLRTRKALRQALVKLIEETPVDEVSVSTLAEEADINRGTFYVHYKSIPNMLVSLRAELARDLKAAIAVGPKSTTSQRSVYTILLSVFEFFEEGRSYYALMMGPNGDSGHMKVVVDVIGETLFALDAESGRNDGFGLNDREYMYAFAIGGLSNALFTWVQNDSVATPQEMALMLSRIVAGKTEAERVVTGKMMESASQGR